MKYEQTQKAPYSALFDRLRAFLTSKDTLLISCGFSFADSHISGRISECLSANPSASVFAFQFNNLDAETNAVQLAKLRPNMSVYARDGAVINCIPASWKIGDPPVRDWSPTQQTFWDKSTNSFILGDFAALAPFLASARTEQRSAPPAPMADVPEPVEQGAKLQEGDDLSIAVKV